MKYGFNLHRKGSQHIPKRGRVQARTLVFCRSSQLKLCNSLHSPPNLPSIQNLITNGVRKERRKERANVPVVDDSVVATWLIPEAIGWSLSLGAIDAVGCAGGIEDVDAIGAC